MITIEFGAAENQTLDRNSLFLKFYGDDFRENIDKIKNYWNRTYLKATKEWEVPFSCFEEIKSLYNNCSIKYLNDPPKAKLITQDEITKGMDFNGYNLYDYQLDGVKYGLNHKNFLLLDEQGLGKAQPYGSLIYTPKGPVKIEDLKIGDFVLGRNHKTKIIGIYDRGILPVYKITFNDNTFTYCSNDHLWDVKFKLKENKYTTVDTNYLLKNKDKTFYIPLVKNSDFNEQKLPLDPYLLGALLGDGGMSGSELSFTTTDSYLVDKINNLLPKPYILSQKSSNPIMYTIVNKHNIDKSGKKDYFKGYYIYFINDKYIGYKKDLYNWLVIQGHNIKESILSAKISKYFNKNGSFYGYKLSRQVVSYKTNEIKHQLDELNLWGCTSKDKFIPSIYKYNSYDNRVKLLKGLIDTDGFISKNGNIQYTSTSPKLLNDVKELCESLGGIVRYQLNMFHHYKRYVTISITFPDNTICCTLPRKLERLKKRNPKSYYKPNRKIKSIEYIEDKHCRCIKVDAEDELYLTNNFIVTHNTLQAVSLARYKKLHQGLKHCLIICGINSLKWNWQREVSKFCKDEKAIVLGTKINSKGNIANLSLEETKKQIEDCPEEFFWIINIEKMRVSPSDKKNKSSIVDYLNYHIEKNNLGMIIIDEVHKCKNINSSQSKGILTLDPKASKMAMTGTLLVNNPYDLYCPMSFIGLINYNLWQFERKYVIKDDWGQVLGYQNMDDLHNILYKSSIRRTKDLLDLPEKIYKQEWLEFSKEEQNIFNQVIGVSAPKDLDKIDLPDEMVAIITRMRQTTVACELLTSKKIQSTKFSRLNDILEEAKMNKQKVLVFCPFTEALKLGLEYCKEYNPKIVMGGMGNKIQQVVDEHEQSEGFSVLFAQEATLGVGYTLINTSIVVFLSPPWSRATYDQCIDRCFVKNTIVMTLDGPKYIQDITTRDYVFTPYGNIKRVTATHIIENNQKLMANIKIKGLGSEYEIKCTADHKILSKDKIWKPVSDFKIGDYVYQIPEINMMYGKAKEINLTPFIEVSDRSKNSQGKVKCSNTSYMYNNKLQIDKEFMFFIGMYLGDGFVQKDFKFISICGNITTKYESLLRIQKYINSICNCSSYICTPKNKGRELRMNIEPLARYIECNFGRIREQKFIPRWIFDLKKDLLQSLLEGLMKSDGYTLYKNNNTKQGQYVTTTPSLATSIWFLLFRLGYKPRFYTKFNYEKRAKREWRIEFNKINNENIKADIDNKVGRITDIKYYSVKNQPKLKLYDISVEDDECYMVGNLPVHNCHRIGQNKTVQVIDLLTKDSYDELIYKKLHGKGAMSDVIIDGVEVNEVKQYFADMHIEFRNKEKQEIKTLLDGID